MSKTGCSRIVLASLLTSLGALQAGRIGQGADTTRDFFNVVLADGADPWVIRHTDGFYYLTCTTGSDVTLWRDRTLSGVGHGEKKVVWRPPERGPNSKEIWGPELHFLQGAWYVYFAASDGDNAHHRMFVLENRSADPFEGEFVDKGQVCDKANDRWAIDGTVASVGNELYFIWSGWEGSENGRQSLYIARMESPLALASERVEISRPTLPWELVGDPKVNEGPEVLVRDKTIYLFFSASGSWTDQYCLGLLTATVGSDLLSPYSWKKLDKPVFASANGVFGPGHASFTKSPDGREDWIVYHAARFQGSGWTRTVRAQKFTFTGGMPRLGQPVPADRPIALPGGEPDRERYEAERGTRGGHARVIKSDHASGGARVGFIDSLDSFVEIGAAVPKDGQYELVVRYMNGCDRGVTSSHNVMITHGSSTLKTDLSYLNTGGWDNALCGAQRVWLGAGTNKIRFGLGTNNADIDCVDVVPVVSSSR
jgi:GH43 family beta-xylosidase